MFEDLYSVPEDDEIDFSLLEDLDDDSDGGGLGALGRKRRKRSTRKGGVRKTARRAYKGLRRKKRTTRKAAPKRRKRRTVSGVGTLGAKRKRRRSTRKGAVRKTARRAYVRRPKRRRRRRSTVAGLAQLIAKAAPARRRKRRGTRKGQARKTARRAYRGLRKARRKARRPIRRAKRKIRRARRRAGVRGLGLGSFGRLGNFSASESKPIIGGFNWAFGGRDGHMSIAGAILGSVTTTVIDRAADKFLGEQEWYTKLKKDNGWAVKVATAAVSSIAGWELGKLAKSKDMSKLAFLFPWAKLFDEKVTGPLLTKVGLKGGGVEGLGSYGGGFGQLRVPDATELDGLSQLRVPDATELDGLGQLRVPDATELDGFSDYDEGETAGVGVGQYEEGDVEDEESNVF